MNKRNYKDSAKSGLKDKLPKVECFRSQFENYKVTVIIPEFTSMCPKTGQPDFGKITIEYEPVDLVIELKSLKEYIQAFRNIGIFYENAVNRILMDIAQECKPLWMVVRGEFNPRGGIMSIVEARYPKTGNASDSK